MAIFIHVNDISAKDSVGAPGQWVNSDAIDILESANRGEDTEITLRCGAGDSSASSARSIRGRSGLPTESGARMTDGLERGGLRCALRVSIVKAAGDAGGREVLRQFARKVRRRRRAHARAVHFAGI